MRTNVNHIRNPDFSLGGQSPRRWRPELDAEACEVFRRPSSAEGPARLAIVPKTPRPAILRQTLRCRPDAYYRVEAVVRCELIAAGPAAGFVLTLRHGDPVDGELLQRHTPEVLFSPEPLTVRAYFHAPEECTEVEIGVGVHGAVGVAEVFEVRFIRILEPDEMSHPLACLPPFAPHRPPVETVCICSEGPAQRPLSTMLALALGESRVSILAAQRLETQRLRTDALLLPDAKPPPAIKNLRTLLALSESKIVVISLPALAALAPTLKLRCIRQPDDPIHAKVVYACEATRGFVLHDCFAFAWPGETPGSFAQNQFRSDEAFKRFCKRHRFETLLVSNCDKDSTSDQPVCLYRPGSGGGGLYVLDLDPIDAPASSFGEPALAAHLLLSILHRGPSPAGQFAAPLRNEIHFRDLIREAASRWDHFYVQDEDAPPDEITHQLVTIGREDEMYGLPVAPKPVILIRSGLFGGDAPSVYGVWAWLRQLLLHSRHGSSYAGPLASKFRLAWLPCLAAWEPGDGWAASGWPPPVPAELEFDGGQVAALIDVCSVTSDGVRVVFAHPSSIFSRAAAWLPRLAAAFCGSEFPAIACNLRAEDVRQPTDPSAPRLPSMWHKVHATLAVTTEPGSFSEPIHRDVIAQGGDAMRIELPRYQADYVAHSIHHTHLAVTVLEHLIGLLYGLIAVNRTAGAIRLEASGIVEPGEALALAQTPSLNWDAVRTG